MQHETRAKQDDYEHALGRCHPLPSVRLLYRPAIVQLSSDPSGLLLLELCPQLGGSACGCAVGQVEDCKLLVAAPNKNVREGERKVRTLLDAVLLAAVLYTLDALLKVVLGGCALLGVSALC